MKKLTKKIKVKTKEAKPKRIKINVVKEEPKIQGSSYWIERTIEDEHKDWNYTGNWIEGYIASADHPHRDLILDNLPEFNSLAEVGCNVGPNLYRINKRFEGKRLAGIDVSPLAIAASKEYLPESIDVQVGSFIRLPWDTQSFDIVLADAVLMYATPDEIGLVLKEMERVGKTLIIVDRFSKEETNNGYVWSRNYPKLLEELGFQVKTIKMKKSDWPGSKGWQESGCIFIAVRPSQISETNS